MNFYTIASKMYDILDLTYFSKKSRNPRNAINEIIQEDSVKILDMCCGTLANSIAIAKKFKNAKILGIDLSKQMLQVAQKRVKKNKFNNISLKCMDATNTHLKEKSFDYILLGLALHEMNPELQRNILKEAFRLLKDEGHLIVLEWEKPNNCIQKILYFPLLASEQLLCKSFLSFYNCDKNSFFKKNGFKICKSVHCNYSVVLKLKKRKE